MPTVRFLTWNLQRKFIWFERALVHLSSWPEPWIACFQEVPRVPSKTMLDGFDALLLNQSSWHFGRATSGQMVSLLLVGSSDLLLVESAAVPTAFRGVAASVDVGKERLHIFGFHQWSRSASPDSNSARRKVASGYRQVVRTSLSRESLDDDRATVIMGDFNAEPLDQEIVGSAGLFAVPDIRDLEKLATIMLSTTDTKQMKPMFNPMPWKMFESEENHMCGSFQHTAKEEAHTWRGYDQIVVSPDLQPAIKNFEIYTELDEYALLNRGGRIGRTVDGEKSPDHLPVQLALDLED